MRVRITQDGLVNWLIALSVGFLVEGAMIAYFIARYMPARADADRRMAEILQFNMEEWERRNTRRVDTWKNSGTPSSDTNRPNLKR